MSGAVELPPPSDAPSRDERSFVRLLFTTPMGELLRGRVTGPVPRFIRTPVASTALPAVLEMFVQDVVKHTRLWRREKREIARELAAHFADGLECGLTPDQLIADFGDPGRAALLLRRAAKRNRPWPWQAMRFSIRAMVAFIFCLVGLYAVLTLRFYLARPGPIVDFRPAMNAAALQVREDDKAWPLYRQALLAMPDRGAIEKTLFQERKYDRIPHPGEEGWDVVSSHLEKWKPAFEFARAAAKKPGFGLIVGYPWSIEDQQLWPDSVDSAGLGSIENSGLIAVLLPHLGHLRNLALALGWDVERAAAAGDGQLALAEVRAILALSRHLHETPTMINAWVAISTMSLACERVNWALANHANAFTEAQLADLAHMLAAMDDRAMRIDYRGERLFFEDVIQRIYSDDGHGDGRVTAKGLEWLQSLAGVNTHRPGEESVDFVFNYAGPAASAVMLGRRDMLDEHARLMDMVDAEAATPLWERDTSKVDTLLESWMRSPLEQLRRFPLALMMPALSRASINAEFSKMRRDVTLIAIALEVHHRQHGEWPDSLDALVPHLLPEVPVDRFDGQPLRYAVREGRPLVYSVGTDREDDGGVAAAYGVHHNAQMWQPRDKIAELLRTQKPVIGASGHEIPYWDGDWLLWPPQDEGPVMRHDPATAP